MDLASTGQAGQGSRPGDQNPLDPHLWDSKIQHTPDRWTQGPDPGYLGLTKLHTPGAHGPSNYHTGGLKQLGQVTWALPDPDLPAPGVNKSGKFPLAWFMSS